MISGMGIDILEISRLRVSDEQNHRLARRILTDSEYTQYISFKKNRQIEFLAGRFSAKEAFAKAFGTGFGKKLSWQDVEVINNEAGKPLIVTNTTNNIIHLSLSHEKNYVVASVIIESLSC